ncbi:serine/threonine-protein kinase [Streptomyces sp. NPDC058583]|uniref:serine/threonine-protein kinase n=1 Tax=unclassified Streptomyces TaxID=2593676 RepID=UPI0036603512
MERGELIAGRYELEKRLGRGGMGEVWAGRDRRLRRDVAIKMLVLDDAVHADLPARFEREAVAGAQISHSNVVALYDYGTHEDLWFLVMERVKGATLAEHLHEDSFMEVARALKIAQEICAALIAAHHAQVIHYDIKPHNVMLTPDGTVKVVDFGIAGFIHNAFTLAHSSQLTPAGTPQYGAPEQFLAERGDARSDLYSLGSVLFALLAGRPPFTGHSALAIMRHKLDEDAPSLGMLRPDLPPAVTRLVAELLDRDPDRRPQTAVAVHEQLVRLQTIPSDPDVPTEPDLSADPDASADPTATDVEPCGTILSPTRRLNTHEAPLETSWTGLKPITEYVPTSITERIPVAALLFVLASAIPAASIYLMVTLKQQVAAADDNDPIFGLMAILILGAVFGVPVALISLSKLVETVRNRRRYGRRGR